MQRAILGVGRQDVLVSGLSPTQPVEILGSSSDHIILNAKNTDIKVGDEVVFIPNYGAMLSAMTSPYVHKQYIYTKKKKSQPKTGSHLFSYYFVCTRDEVVCGFFNASTLKPIIPNKMPINGTT